MKGIQVCSKKGYALFQGEIITILLKYIQEFEKSYSPEPLGQLKMKGIQADNYEIAKIQ